MSGRAAHRHCELDRGRGLAPSAGAVVCGVVRVGFRRGFRVLSDRHDLERRQETSLEARRSDPPRFRDRPHRLGERDVSSRGVFFVNGQATMQLEQAAVFFVQNA